MRLVLVCALATSLGGCATITRGTTDQITITTDPEGARVTTSLSQSCISPCTLTVGRKDEFIVSVSADGYKPQEIPVKTQLAGGGTAAFASNILLGSVVGMGVDASTGATLEHVPNPVHVALEPLESPPPERPLAKRPKPKTSSAAPGT